MIKYILPILILVGCGTEQSSRTARTGQPGEDGRSCEITQIKQGVMITCEDSQQIIHHGIDGDKGEQGEQGKQGDKGNRGKRGKRGKRGERGRDGADGVVDSNNITAGPFYIGYYCSRVVLDIHGIVYIVHGQLIPLTEKYLIISNTCKVKIAGDEVMEKRD